MLITDLLGRGRRELHHWFGSNYRHLREGKFDTTASSQLRVDRSVDPTRSMGRRDSLLNEKKMWVDFRILENPSPRRNSFSLESPLTFCCYFIKGKTK